MAECRSLLEQERGAQSSLVECLDQDEDSASDATAATELPSNNRVPVCRNWWPAVKSMPWKKPGLLGGFTYRVEEEASEGCTHLARKNVQGLWPPIASAGNHSDMNIVHQARLQLPHWMLQKTWDFQFYRSYDGWKFQLKNWNVRPNDSAIFRFVQEGRTDLVLDAFDRNEASLYDVDEDGKTLIEVYPPLLVFSFNLMLHKTDEFQVSLILRRQELLKELHMMGLKICNIDAFDLITHIFLWYQGDRTATEIFKLWEEDGSLDDFTYIDNADYDHDAYSWALLAVSLSVPELNVLSHKQAAETISNGFRWEYTDPKIPLSMLAGGFATPAVLRETDRAVFTWAYFHALLNNFETESWRLLARKIFVGATPMEVASPPHLCQARLPLLCGVLAQITWTSFPIGAFERWLSNALLMWMEDLAEAGLNLREYIRAEILVCRGTDMQLRPGIRFLEFGPSLVVLNYGDNPQDWVFEWDSCVEGMVGEFWNIIEFPPMPGAWVDDDPDDESKDEGDPYQCYMGQMDWCEMASTRYWFAIKGSGIEPNSLGVRGIPMCGNLQYDWILPG